MALQNKVDISFVHGDQKFNYRVAALMISDGKLLAMRDRPGSYLYLPGGCVLIGEDAEQAIAHELKEELDITTQIERPLRNIYSLYLTIMANLKLGKILS